MVRSAGMKGLTALDSATAWLNTPPLTATDLRGSVVVVNFWTYTVLSAPGEPLESKNVFFA